jgi:hypothetical protein
VPRIQPGPEINDISQLLDAVRLGGAVAYVPVSDLSPSEVLAAWPAASRSPAIAAFVRTAAETAANWSPVSWENLVPGEASVRGSVTSHAGGS